MCSETSNLWVMVGRILCRHQQQFSVNVWAGIVGDCLVDPHVLPHQLTGHHYRDFLIHDLPKLLGDVPLAVRARKWYMHDSAPAHFRPAVRDVLNDTYRDRWTGRGGPTAWPPCSPDLNPLDFFLWKHLNTLVYAVPVDKEEARHHRVMVACQTIRNYPGIFARMLRSMMRRVEACLESHGGHSEHLLLMYSFSCTSQIKCFRTYVDMNIVSCFGVWNSCPKFVRTFQLYSV
jgi:hypothetical protein